MDNNKRKQGWYWCKLKNNVYVCRYYTGLVWYNNGEYFDDLFFQSINEQRITMPDEPNVLDNVITSIKEDIQLAAFSNQVYGKQLLSIIEQLKATL